MTSSSTSAKQLVSGHVGFAVRLATQMGDIQVAICAPLHRRHACLLPMQEYNAKVDECVGLLREELMQPEYQNVKQLDMWAFKITNVCLWEHKKMRGITQCYTCRGGGDHRTKLCPSGSAHPDWETQEQQQQQPFLPQEGKVIERAAGALNRDYRPAPSPGTEEDRTATLKKEWLTPSLDLVPPSLGERMNNYGKGEHQVTTGHHTRG